VSKSVLDDVVEHSASASQLQLLTVRQREVVQLIAEGYSNITL
jgi:DNA-binding CsgD family transcriptional regulator